MRGCAGGRGQSTWLGKLSRKSGGSTTDRTSELALPSVPNPACLTLGDTAFVKAECRRWPYRRSGASTTP